MPILPPLPPSTCSDIAHSIWNSSIDPNGCSNAVWQYLFQSQATLATVCNCVDNPGPPVVHHGLGAIILGG
ncbi:MAG: hypothetical protein K1X79_06220, partial [Oligoflexia bacterium]|nr:hypothetical protein [Oligoflexia bacterium]